MAIFDGEIADTAVTYLTLQIGGVIQLQKVAYQCKHIETCERCKGQVKIIACIEDPAVIERILLHLKGKEPSAELAMLPEGRAPPQARLFD